MTKHIGDVILDVNNISLRFGVVGVQARAPPTLRPDQRCTQAHRSNAR